MLHFYVCAKELITKKDNLNPTRYFYQDFKDTVNSFYLRFTKCPWIKMVELVPPPFSNDSPLSYLRVEYSTSPGMGPIISCWQLDQRGSGVGHPDLNQYFPFPCLLVNATMESSWIYLTINILTNELSVVYQTSVKDPLRRIQKFFLSFLDPDQRGKRSTVRYQ